MRFPNAFERLVPSVDDKLKFVGLVTRLGVYTPGLVIDFLSKLA